MCVQVNPRVGVTERSKAEASWVRSLMNLFAIAENYLDSKADGNFQHLHIGLSDIENKIAATRRFLIML